MRCPHRSRIASSAWWPSVAARQAAGGIRAHRGGYRRDGHAHARGREGSIGVPAPDMRVMICRPGTDEELPVGEDGEICVHGPAIMLGYLDDPSATARVLKQHRDGRTWLHTEDIGHRDADGILLLPRATQADDQVLRLQRLSRGSRAGDRPARRRCGGLRDRRAGCVQGERSRRSSCCERGRFKPDACAGDHHALPGSPDQVVCPRDVEFRSEFPRTRIGKVDFRALARSEPVAGVQ